MAYALRDLFGRKYLVGQPAGARLQLGSDPGNTVVLVDPQVAPFHAALWEEQGSLVLEDTSGGRGTWANRVPVQGRMMLRMGDQVTVGSTTFTVVDPNMPSTPAAGAAPSAGAKKGIGCGRWLLIAAVIFALELVCLAGAGFYAYSTDVEANGLVQDLADLRSPPNDRVPVDANLPGPEILNLNDLWLKSNDSPSFSQHEQTTVDALNPSGSAIKIVISWDAMQQSVPDWMSYNLFQKITNGKVVNREESGIIKGKVYSGSGTCVVADDSQAGNHANDETPFNLLTQELSGHVRRVEAGVQKNGVMTDRYEIRADNFIRSDALLAVQAASLYRARVGGYLAELEYTVKIKPQSWTVNSSDEFSDIQPATVTYLFSRTYTEQGKLTVKVPAACADQVK